MNPLSNQNSPACPSPSDRPKRVLFVAYQFPPVGGIGVHRVVKFVKYLPEFGWESSVLTVSNPSVPLLDASHEADIPPATRIVRAPTWEPGYRWKQKFSALASSGTGKSPAAAPPQTHEQAGKKSAGSVLAAPGRWLKRMLRSTANLLLQPDPQVLWSPNALSFGKQLLRDHPHDVIIATAPPFSSFLVGEKLARYAGIPLVLDYRDEWGISNSYWENKQQDACSRWIQTRMQARVLRAAQAAIATTPSSCRSIQAAAHQAQADVQCDFIYNGYDPSDFPTRSVADEKSSRLDYGNGRHKFRLAYVGTLWNLNSIEPLIQALELLSQFAPRLTEQVELVVAGRRTAEQERLLDRLHPLPCAFVRLPFLPHNEAIQLMRTSDCLTLLNSPVPGAERIVNGKIFEYLATHTPFLLISPRGDMWDLTSDCPYAHCCDPTQPQLIAERLADLLEQYRLDIPIRHDQWDPTQHERRHRASQLAELLDRLLNPQSGVSPQHIRHNIH